MVQCPKGLAASGSGRCCQKPFRNRCGSALYTIHRYPGQQTMPVRLCMSRHFSLTDPLTCIVPKSRWKHKRRVDHDNEHKGDNEKQRHRPHETLAFPDKLIDLVEHALRTVYADHAECTPKNVSARIRKGQLRPSRRPCTSSRRRISLCAGVPRREYAQPVELQSSRRDGRPRLHRHLR